MPSAYLVTGPPRSGKTTAIRRTVERLRDRGLTVGGVAAPERREDGQRVGFEVVDLSTGDAAVLAHVDRTDGPAVGKYRVSLAGLDRVAGPALERAREEADVAVVDEVAPMQAESEPFRAGVRTLLADPTPVVAAVQAGSEGLAGELKAREDTRVFEVTPGNRDDLPGRLTAAVLGTLE